jgi:hypothetical protein
VLGPDVNATSTDLQPFADRGGKLILYAGWAGPLIPSPSTSNYFNALAQTMSGSQAAGAMKETRHSPACSWRRACGTAKPAPAPMRSAA